MRSWLKPTRTKMMCATDAAWLAGFFDGEGSLCKYFAGRNKKYITWVFTIANTNLPSLVYCNKITGVGKPRVKIKSTAKRKTCYEWRVASQNDMVSVCQQILPYLTIKKDRVQKFLNNWKPF